MVTKESFINQIDSPVLGWVEWQARYALLELYIWILMVARG